MGDEVFVAGTTNKKGKVTSLIDNALSSSSEGAKLLVITLEDGEEYKTAAIFVKSPVYSLNRIQAMMKWAGIKKETIDDESDIDKEKEEKEKAEKEKLARLNEIKGKITNQTFIDALKETTKESESLSITGIDNNDLNKNRSAIVDLLPKLKQLKIEGTKSDQLSTDPSARNKLDENILQFFRTNIETLELPNNYLTDLSWLRGQSQLKKIDVSDNGITTINYDDLQDLPAGCEIILKGNNPISQEI
ncbi:hypothetical protein FACS1894176_07390 [Bacteroidia bacterium]|nr:hypothetical protein FACS1894176_07390 [Bacteroidia bacterium]